MLIKGYNRFIFESLLLESELEFSTDIVNKLSLIRKSNRIANAIYTAFKKWSDIPNLKFNDFKLSDKDDMVSFMPINQNGVIDNTKKRSELKIGRLVRQLSDVMKLNASNQEIEDFVNKWKSTKERKDNRFEVISGEDIVIWYNEENYAPGFGNLNKSCLRFEYCDKMLDMYVKNPDRIKLLILVDGREELIGRSLLWTLDESPSDSKLYMDRIYTTEDYIVNNFIKWANDNNYMIREMNNSEKKWGTKFLYKDKKVEGVISLTINDTKLRELPYADTLKFFNKQGYLSNVGFHGSVLLEDINGGYETCICGGTAEDVCEYCDGTGQIWCTKCKGFGESEGGEACNGCEGKGDFKCDSCKGEGIVECPDCAAWKSW